MSWPKGKKRPNPGNPTGKGGVRFTKENAAAMGAKGGRKNGENAAKRASMKECARAILDTASPTDSKIPMAMLCMKALIEKSASGDVPATRLLCELMGEMEQTINVKELPKLIDDV